MIFLAAFLFFLLIGCKESIVCVEKPVVAFGAITGFVLALIFCAVDFLFFSSVHFAVYNLKTEFVQLFTAEALIPLAVCFAVYFLFNRDSVAFKLQSFAFVLLGFFMLFTPYRILTRYSILSPFCIAVKPLAVFALILGEYFALSAAGSILQSSKKALAVPCFLLALVILPLPALTETGWFLASPIMLWGTIFIVLCVFAFVFLPILKSVLCKIAQNEK